MATHRVSFAGTLLIIGQVLGLLENAPFHLQYLHFIYELGGCLIEWMIAVFFNENVVDHNVGRYQVDLWRHVWVFEFSVRRGNLEREKMINEWHKRDYQISFVHKVLIWQWIALQQITITKSSVRQIWAKRLYWGIQLCFMTYNEHFNEISVITFFLKNNKICTSVHQHSSTYCTACLVERAEIEYWDWKEGVMSSIVSDLD